MSGLLRAIAVMSLLLGSPALAQSASPPPPPPSTAESPPPQREDPQEPHQPELPIDCDPKASPDYVPGIDARGNEVAPADLSYGREAEIGTEIFVEMRSYNRRVRGTGVIVNLPELGAPACVRPQDKSPR